MRMACFNNVDDVASCMLYHSRIGTVAVVVSGMKTYRLSEILHIEDCSGSNFHWLFIYRTLPNCYLAALETWRICNLHCVLDPRQVTATPESEAEPPTGLVRVMMLWVMQLMHLDKLFARNDWRQGLQVCVLKAIHASGVRIPLRPVRKSRRPTSTWQIVKSAFKMHVWCDAAVQGQQMFVSLCSF